VDGSATGQPPVQDYLAALGSEPAPTDPERRPRPLSPSDPAPAWTMHRCYEVMFGYSLNYLVDSANAILVLVRICRS
jgi:hypothetical protein